MKELPEWRKNQLRWFEHMRREGKTTVITVDMTPDPAVVQLLHDLQEMQQASEDAPTIHFRTYSKSAA